MQTNDDAHPPPQQEAPYPWSLCIARFLRRLFFSVLAWVVLAVLLILSAIPYGGGNGSLSDTLRLATVALPCWALAGFLPPLDTWGRDYSTRRIATYAGLIAALPVAVGIWAYHAMATSDQESATRRERRNAAMLACSADLQAISAPVIAHSLLIDMGSVDRFMLRDLLGYRGMRFVELRAHEHHRRSSDAVETTWGVESFMGSEGSSYNVPREVNIVRLSLARHGDPSCTTRPVLHLQDAMGQAPTAPDACLRVELDRDSRASHVLKSIPAASGTGFIRWALAEQAGGAVLASLTSLDTPPSPQRLDAGEASERKTIGDDIVSCHSPHYSLLNLVHGPARQPDERLSLGQRHVAIDIGQADPPDPAAWESLVAREDVVDDWDARQAARSGPAWPDAYRAAERSGWAPYADGVIDFGRGEVVLARLSSRPSFDTLVRGSAGGFLLAWGMRNGSVALAHFGLDARLRWKRAIVPDDPAPQDRGAFSLVGMTWDPDAVRLYGFRRITDGEGSEVRVLQVPAVRLPRDDGAGRKNRASSGSHPAPPSH